MSERFDDWCREHQGVLIVLGLVLLVGAMVLDAVWR